MTFTPHGKHLIAGEWVTTDSKFYTEPASGPAQRFHVGTVHLVGRAAEAAEEALNRTGFAGG